MMYVMLLWIGMANGGPAVITGFESLDSCISQKAEVAANYKLIGWLEVKAICISLRK